MNYPDNYVKNNKIISHYNLYSKVKVKESQASENEREGKSYFLNLCEM